MFNRRSFLITALSSPVVASLATPALAAKPEIYAPQGLAIKGYDPVGYFTQSTHVKGLAQHSLNWKGAEWRFASADTMATFQANPAGFAPQYGGYCAFAVAHGATAKTDPDAWTIHEGKLYLNFNISVRTKWRKDIPGFVSRADQNWPTVLEA
ncbi:YHS domain-containing (seleno)protein [Cognatishimia sp. WU-CL00825]|uniref:YHS domain-containing (seleno)protein n=1 Tax=Cognatishimia sp. WU-CL00825 TaxID=3127658 RepID=UPI003106A942